MKRFLSPTVDVVFKLLFASPETRESLISVLTAVLRPATPIVDVEVLNPEVPREAVMDKGIVLDLLVRLGSGARIDVEMQVERRRSFRQRALFYWSRSFGSQLSRGQPYRRLEPTVFIAFLCYEELPARRLHSTYRVLEVHDHEPFSEHLELHLIELPKLDSMSDDERAREAALIKWTTFFTARTDEELEAACQGDITMEKTKDFLEILSARPSVQELARVREMAYISHQLEVHAVREEGRAEGLTEGEARGKAEGKAEGILTLLSVRGFDIDEATRERVLSCKDEAALDRWLRSAVTAESLEALFG